MYNFSINAQELRTTCLPTKIYHFSLNSLELATTYQPRSFIVSAICKSIQLQVSQLIEISHWINPIDHPKNSSFLLSHYDLSFNVYLLCEASLLVTIIVTGPVLMFLNIDIASLWDIPCTDIPLTDNTSSPKIRHPLYKVLFLEFVLF